MFDPMFASSLVKTQTPTNSPRVCSTEGRMYFSLHTDSLNFVKSTQICGAPQQLLHTVGSSTLLMTPKCSMHCSTFLTLDMSGRGMCRWSFECMVSVSVPAHCTRKCAFRVRWAFSTLMTYDLKCDWLKRSFAPWPHLTLCLL